VDGTPSLHPDVAALAPLLGTWTGAGAGVYPTIASFGYGEEATFTSVGKPFLAYRQRTWAGDDDRPLHAEAGYWRAPGPGRSELVVAHPTGLVEVDEGTVETTTSGVRLSVVSLVVAGTSSAKDVAAVRRHVEVDDDVLRYTIDMAAVGEPLQRHLEAELTRAR
jgi:hypothetical protein